MASLRSLSDMFSQFSWLAANSAASFFCSSDILSHMSSEKPPGFITPFPSAASALLLSERPSVERPAPARDPAAAAPAPMMRPACFAPLENALPIMPDAILPYCPDPPLGGSPPPAALRPENSCASIICARSPIRPGRSAIACEKTVMGMPPILGNVSASTSRRIPSTTERNAFLSGPPMIGMSPTVSMMGPRKPSRTSVSPTRETAIPYTVSSSASVMDMISEMPITPPSSATTAPSAWPSPWADPVAVFTPPEISPPNPAVKIVTSPFNAASVSVKHAMNLVSEFICVGAELTNVSLMSKPT